MLVFVMNNASYAKLHLLSKNEHKQGQHRLKAEAAEDEQGREVFSEYILKNRKTERQATH